MKYNDNATCFWCERTFKEVREEEYLYENELPEWGYVSGYYYCQPSCGMEG